MNHWILGPDRVPVPVTLLEWGMWIDNPENKRVAETTVDDKWISTVFLGLDHRFGGGPPILFETMVFGSAGFGALEYQTRCATWNEAVLMHNRAVAWVQAGCPDGE